MRQTIERYERGWPGHFIGCRHCEFRLNTLLHDTSNDTRIVVSTVGRYKPDFPKVVSEKMKAVNEKFGIEIQTDGFESLGAGQRHFETMAFHAILNEGEYWDADVEREVGFEANWALDHPHLENEANAMHEGVVQEIWNRMDGGEWDSKEN